MYVMVAVSGRDAVADDVLPGFFARNGAWHAGGQGVASELGLVDLVAAGGAEDVVCFDDGAASALVEPATPSRARCCCIRP